jgi:hypothetical protein
MQKYPARLLKLQPAHGKFMKIAAHLQCTDILSFCLPPTGKDDGLE